MARFRLAGGHGRRRGAPRVTWNGGRVVQAINQAVEDAMRDEATEVVADLKGSIHRISGRMAEESYAEVEVRAGRRTLVAGSTAPYAIYEELRHPVIREVMDRHIPHVPPRIRAKLGGGR
jgi:hypothetical protein